MDMVFNHLPNEEILFDYDRFFSSEEKLAMGVSDCASGKTVYPFHKNDRNRLMQLCKASNSLPFVSEIVKIDNVAYMDGGVINPLPVKKAIEDGYKKLVIILTQKKGFIKKPTPVAVKLARLKYHKYPKFVEQIKSRPERYNKTIKWIEEMEENGQAFVFRPQTEPCGTAEKDAGKLYEFYQYGYGLGKERFSEMMEFIRSV